MFNSNCTINGTLSMNQRGAYADPTSSGGSDNNAVDTNGLRLPMLTSGGSDSLTVSASLFNGCKLLLKVLLQINLQFLVIF